MNANDDAAMSSDVDTDLESWGTEQAAAFLRVHRDTISELACTGKVPAAKFGKAWVFLKADLVALIREKAEERARLRRGNVECVAAELRDKRRPGSLAARLDARLKELKANPPKKRQRCCPPEH
jgi:excisionase family DNA binding protein